MDFNASTDGRMVDIRRAASGFCAMKGDAITARGKLESNISESTYPRMHKVG